MLYDEYSYWKGIHFQDKLKSIKENIITSPVNLHLSITDQCNNNCYYCYVKEQNSGYNEIQPNKIISVLEDARLMGVKAIELTGGGEPTTHPFFYDILEVMKQLEFDVGLTTNGSNVIPDKLTWLKWIRISVDSFDRFLYKKIRNANIPDFDHFQPLFNSNVIMGASCVINKYNYRDIFVFAQQAQQIGFDNVWLKPCLLKNKWDIPHNRINFCKKQIEKVELLNTSSFKSFCTGFDDIIHESGTKFNKCMQQYLCTYIDADGTVYPCCSLQGMKDFQFGNINEKSFQQIWAERSPLSPENCPLKCFWYKKNSFLNYVINDHPIHVNFI